MKKRTLPHRHSRLSLAVALAFSAGTMQALAQTQPLPAGGQVTAGSGTVSQPSATSLLVKQTTDKMAMTWRSFDIGAGHSVRFDQPSASSIALNRVTGGSRSEIYGSLSANGQVFLVNPNGILFGRGAQVDVGGLVASTLNITDRDFLDGKYVFSDPSNRGSVINEGALSARDHGYLILLGSKTVNQGTMLAHLGSVALGAGGAVQLTLADNRLIKFQVTEGALDALAENGGLIRADGGRVILTAGARDSLLASVVNNTGVIEARTVERQAGNILLLAGMEAGTTNVGGTLDASAPNGGDGGFVETSAARVRVEKDLIVTTNAPQGKTGTWLIDPQNYTIAASGGDITGAALSSSLASSNVVIESSSGSAAGAGDINVNDAVSWSANQLTLTAAHDININAVMSATGSSSLVMNTATANGADAGVPGGTVKVGLDPVAGFSGRVDFDRSGTGFLTINGAGYTVINSLGSQGSTTGLDLQGMAGNLSGHYALGANVDASATSAWSAGAGFAPVGNLGTPFVGTFDGLGHAISGLTINLPAASSQVGLFGATTGATLRNVDLAGGSVAGGLEVGGLVGRATTSTIHNVRSGVAARGSDVGGLIGLQVAGSTSNAHATGVVTGGQGHLEIGGLVGLLDSGSLDNVSASGDIVSGGTSTGGLVGASFSSTISNARASGNITSGTSNVGGLVGLNGDGSISDSYATGNVTTGGAGVNVGGLVGTSDSTSSIARSYATGSVAGRQNVGGLAGQNDGALDDVHATGSVTGVVGGQTSGLGGLLGANTAVVTNAYATGNVTYAGSATNFVSGAGGLIGINTGAVSGSYASGNVTVSGTNSSATPSENVGGLVGENHGALNTVSASGVVSNTGIRTGGIAGFNDGTIFQATGFSASVSGGGDYAGGLVGRNESTITNSGTYADVTSQGNFVGGAVGYNFNGDLTDVFAEGAVLANGTGAKGQMVGGLVGQMAGGSIADGQAQGSVTGQRIVGGLVGYLGGLGNTQNITDSHAAGAVTGLAASTGADVGGLIGQAIAFTGSISNVEAMGSVTSAGDLVGGLIGRHFDGAVSNAVARGSVQGRSQVGGLMGFSAFTIDNSHAEGNVVAANNAGVSSAGGLVGHNESDIHNAYATGSVQGTGSKVGGLIGENLGAVSGSYATGAVGGAGSTGGLVGVNAGGNIAASYHTTGAVTGTGSHTGGLVGDNSGVVSQSYATANVSGVDNVGGLIGSNSGDVSTSYYDTGTVTGTGSNTGGLIGNNVSALTLSGVHAGGVVNGVTNTGGLIGYNTANLSNAYATGAVSGTTATGGLIGFNDNLSASPTTVSQVHAAGNVSGGSNTGGLIGDVEGATAATISDAYATGTVSGTNNTGGLIGRLDLLNTATRVFAAGAVTGAQATGGLVGTNSGHIEDAYATGPVTGTASAPSLGGVVGNMTDGSVQRVYAAGPITNNGTPTANNTTGAVIGKDTSSGTGIADIYWDAGVIGNAFFTIGGTSSLAGRLSGTRAKLESSYVGFDFTTTWIIYQTFTRPLLRTFMTPLTVTANDAAKTYDGAPVSDGNGVTYSAVPNANLLGTLDYGGSAMGARNAGSYAITPRNLYSDQLGYLITFVDGTYTITPAPLTLSTSSVTKTYDSGFSASGTPTVISGTLFGSDSLGTGSFEFLDKNAGTNKSVKVNSIALNDGNGGGNYLVSYVNNTTSTIDKATVSSSGITANNKVYDGTPDATLNTAAGVLTGVFLNDDVSLPTSGVTASFLDRHAGTGKTVNLAGATLSGADAGNYILTAPSPVTADITPAPLTLSTTSVTKTYDGGLTAAGSLVAVGGTQLFGLDSMSGGSFAFTDKNAGSGNKTVTVSGATVSDGNGGANYSVSYVDNGTSTINPYVVNLSGTRSYDGTAVVAAGIFSMGALVGSETLNLTGAGTIADRHVGPKTVGLGTLALGDGTGLASNYTLVGGTRTASITQADLTLSTSDVTKTYDGAVGATGSATVVAGTLFGSDSLGTGSFEFRNVNAGTGKSVKVNSIALNDGNGGDNYHVTYVDNTTSTITQAALTLAATADTRTYNGSDGSSGAVTASGLVGSDSFAATQRFDSANAGSRVLSVNSYTVNDGNGGSNYAVGTTTASGTISQAALTVTANDLSKIVGTTYSFAGTEFSATGLVAGEAIGSVLLSSPGAAASATIGASPYAITASGAAGGTFSLSNYNVTYVGGAMTVVAAPPPPAPASAPVTAADASGGSTGNSAAMQAAILSAQKFVLLSGIGAPGDGSRGLNVTVIGAGINLPQGVK